MEALNWIYSYQLSSLSRGATFSLGGECGVFVRDAGTPKAVTHSCEFERLDL